MFKPMAMTVSFAIIGAMLLCLTYIPMVSSVFLRRNISEKKNLGEKIMDFIKRLYEPVIKSSLKYKKTVLAIALSLFIISIIIFSRMGGEFIPTLEEGDFAVESRLASGSSLSQTIATSIKAEQILLKNFP